MAETAEILMQFVPIGEPALRAECRTDVSGHDKLAKMELPGMAPGFVTGRYFLVDTFKFGVELRDGETDSQRKAQHGIGLMAEKAAIRPRVQQDVDNYSRVQQHVDKHFTKAEQHAVSKGGDVPKLPTVESFSRWRSSKGDSWKKDAGAHPYSAKIDEFSFTRRIDKSSITLFDYCCKQKSFAFASMVKRRSAPVAGSDLPEGQSYLRLDFKDIVISSLKWNDDDVIEESCTFHAKKMRSVYWAEKKMGLQAPSDVLSFLNGTTWELQVKPGGGK